MSNKKDVLFLCQFFYPQSSSSALLPYETAKDLASRGFTVDALVGGAVRGIPKKETVDGVGVTRLRYLHPSRGGLLGKLIGYASFAFAALGSVKKLGRYRAVVVYTNPPILPLAALAAKRRFGTKLIFVAYDVYPEIAEAVGAISPRGLTARLMRRLNRALYRSADTVVALADEMREYLLAHRKELDPARIVTIHNWATGVQLDAPRPEHQAPVVVSYIGNVGPCQELETLLGAASLLRQDDRVRFMILGSGSRMAALAQQIRNLELQNVQLCIDPDTQTIEEAFAQTDLAVIGLRAGLTGLCAPSKYYNHLQFGHALLAVADADSYLYKEIQSADLGRCAEPGDSARLYDGICELAENAPLRAEMGKRAKALYEKKYSKARAMEQYAAVIAAQLN